jgi:hypothetical protein
MLEKMGKAMKYQTVSERQKGWALIALLISILTFFSVVQSIVYGYYDLPLFPRVLIVFGGFLFFIYTWTTNYVRRIFYKKAIRFDGTIVAAEGLYNAGGENTFYLIIEFFDGDEKRLKYTQAYYGNPNHYLKSKHCSVYKYRGKYLEGDFMLNSEKEYANKIIKTELYYNPWKMKRKLKNGKSYV